MRLGVAIGAAAAIFVGATGWASSAESDLPDPVVEVDSAPRQVTGLTAVAADLYSVDLSWDALEPTEAGATTLSGYLIHVDWEFVAFVPTSSTSYRIAYAREGEHRFEVRGVDLDNRFGEPAVLVSDAGRPDTRGPYRTPTLTSTTTDAGLTLTWAAIFDGSLSGYLVHRNDEFVAFVPAGTTTWTDPTVAAGPTTYHVRGVDQANNFGGAHSITVGGGDSVAPPAPSNLRVTLNGPVAGGFSWTATWDAVEDAPSETPSGLSGYWLAITVTDNMHNVFVPAGATSYTFDAPMVWGATAFSIDKNNNFSAGTYVGKAVHPTKWEAPANWRSTMVNDQIIFAWDLPTTAPQYGSEIVYFEIVANDGTVYQASADSRTLTLDDPWGTLRRTSYFIRAVDATFDASWTSERIFPHWS